MKHLHVSFGQYCLEVETWPSAEEMKSHLDRKDPDHLALDSESGEAIAFLSLGLVPGTSTDPQRSIGIACGSLGTAPHLLLEPERSRVVVGFDREVAAISIPDLLVQFRVTCDSPVFQLVAWEQPRLLLVIHEIGVIAVEDDGRERWSYSKEIICGWRIQEGRLGLVFLDALPVDLEIASGRPVAAG